MKRSVWLIALLFMMVGCTGNGTTEKITDKDTSSEITVVENIESNMILHQHMYDNMDRGNRDYYDKEVVVDSKFNVADLKRGDVVFLNNENNEKTISRIVALPGEKVSVKEGTVYIDGKMLDSFYGIAKRVGLDKESYIKKMDDAGNDYNKGEAVKIFELDMDEVEISDNEYYLIDDDWLRGKMTLLEQGDFLGKVIGYSK